MQHLPTDALAALALGESDARAEHLDSCAPCRAELTALRATADRMRAAHVAPVEPPAGVWDRILADIAPDVLRHRLVLSYDALADDIPADRIVARLMEAVALPAVAPRQNATSPPDGHLLPPTSPPAGPTPLPAFPTR